MSEYLDGTLDAATAGRVARQLERCSGCAAELEALRETVHLLQDLAGAEPSPGFADQVMARIERGDADPGWRGRTADQLRAFFESGFGAPLATGAAALLVIAVVQDVEIAVQLPGVAPGAEVAVVADAPAEPLAARPEGDPRLRGLSGAAAPIGPAAPSLASRHRRQLAEAAGDRVPSLDDCLKGRASNRVACDRWHPLMIELALRDTGAFLAEVDSVPGPARERWIGELSRFAGDAGSAPLLAHELRASGDPRASRLAPRFERAALALPR